MIPCEYREMLDVQSWSGPRYALAVYIAPAEGPRACAVAFDTTDDPLSMQQAFLEVRRRCGAQCAFPLVGAPPRLWQTYADFREAIPELDTRMAHALWYTDEVHSLQQFLALSPHHMRRWRNVGPKTIARIMAVQQMYRVHEGFRT